MDERLRFVQDVHRPGWSIAELCRRYAVSRKTGYKWLRAYERACPGGLADGSHRPHASPQATPPAVWLSPPNESRLSGGRLRAMRTTPAEPKRWP